MPAPFFPDEACFKQAEELKAILAGSKVRLFKAGMTPNVGTTRAQLEAQECDYSTYAEKTITAWGNPIRSDAGGAQITAPTIQFSVSTTPVVANMVGGYWIEDAGEVGPPAVDPTVRLIRRFDQPVGISEAHDGLTITPTIIVPNGMA